MHAAAAAALGKRERRDGSSDGSATEAERDDSAYRLAAAGSGAWPMPFGAVPSSSGGRGGSPGEGSGAGEGTTAADYASMFAAMSAGAGGAGGASCAASREASSAALGDVLLSSRPSGSEGDAMVGKATVGAEASREAVDPPTKSPARRVHPATEMAVERRQRHSSADYFPTIRVTRRERHKSHEW